MIYSLSVSERRYTRTTENITSSIIDLHAQGKTDTEIAEILDRNESSITNYRKKAGLLPNKKTVLWCREEEHPAWKFMHIIGDKPNSLDLAKGYLGKRLIVRELGGNRFYVLDGKPGATVMQIIAAANAVCAAQNKPLLGRIRP